MAAMMLATACNSAPAVNRVQPGALSKAIFDGEYYFLQTVIDTPYSASYTFVGEQGTTERVEWEIQQDYLIARRAYEHIANSEPDGLATGTETNAAIAMYRIESHFDIRRGYNPVTGEETNVIEENTSDRPWYQRDYIRVDWSENLITNNDFLVGAKLFDGIQSEPVSYYVEPGTGHPHEPQFVPNDDGEIGYIDIVNKMFVRPTTIYLEGFGDIPTCYLLSQGHLDCAPGEITIRNSFLRVDESRDYEPMEYTGDRMERFGYFLTERAGYDTSYGVTEPARFRFANRHNLWQQSHRMVDGELVRCTESNAEATCGSNGSVCDIAYGQTRREKNDAGEWLGACTIPYREREIRPIAYHLSSNFPEDLLADAEDIAVQWNAPFVETVSSLRENECLATGGDAATCAAERTREDHQQMFVLCHSPVADTDHEACGEPGTVAQIGDLRYNLLAWVNEPHASSPLGYGPSSADPLTGEIIMGNAFIYGAGMETLQAFARDILGLLTGDLSESQISSGSVVEAWVERNRSPASRESHTDHAHSIVDVDIEGANAAMDFSWVRGLMGERMEHEMGVQPVMRAFEQARQSLIRNGAFGDGTERGDARLYGLRGTDIERVLTNSEMRLAAGIDPSLTPNTDAVLEAASPLRGMSLSRIEALSAAHRRLETESHCMLHADFADEGLLGLAREIQRAVESGDGTVTWYGQTYNVRGSDGNVDLAAVLQMVRHPIFHGVTEHEIGHTVGLRHNFSGSFDALNYNPQYWTLRDDGDMRPRAYDPMSDAEIDGRIMEYAYSTVMDYGHNFVVTDAHGLGHYDHAAIKMGYGDMVEVFTNASNTEDVNWWHFIQNAGWPVPLRLEAFTGGELSAYEYTQWPSVVGSREAMEQRADVPYTSLRPDSFLASQGIGDNFADAEGRPVVPYMFCSDEQRDLGPDCMLYDAGADPFETVGSVIDSYWNYYIFNAFRRGRLGFSTESYANRIHGRYFTKLKYANQIYTLYRTVFDEIFGDDPSFDRFWTRPDGMGAYTAAVDASFRLFTRVITVPEPGDYDTDTRADGAEVMLPTNGGGLFFDGVSVDAFDGRALETTWNFDAGYFWRDQLERAGYFFDKALAIQVLVDPNTNFVGRDTSADLRRYQISFHSNYAQAMDGFFGGLLSEDWSTISPREVEGELTYPSALELIDGSMAGTPIDPNASFTVQLYAMVYGMALIPETYDRGYFYRSRIWIDGDAVTPSTGSEVSFTDPNTGVTFHAVSELDRFGNETAPAARMLNYAQQLADEGATAEAATYVDALNYVRRLSWLFEYGG